jgi:PAS domain S-box-containing protein
MAGTAQSTRDLPLDNSAEEMFRLAVESCPSGMVMTDGAGRIVLVNAEAERLFGYQRHELIGQKMEMLVPERLRTAYFQRRAALTFRPERLRFGESSNLFGRRRDGTEFPVEVELNPIRTAAGLLVLGVYIDISERTRVEHLKDEFVSTVSHELRTPLTSIAGSLGLLVGGAAGELPETAMRLISIAQSNSQRLVRLINDILDIEKIESGQIAFKFKRLSARALAEQVIEANRGYADGFHVRVRLADDAAVGEVYADADRLAQVITNLLSNAIKFSPADAEVTVAIGQSKESVRIAVRDHGPGIPREFRPRIFEKFAQADASDTRQKGGTGLGLSIVKEIVARLGGTVGFEDASGGGTVFYVELPSWSQIGARASDTDTSAATARILLCEDDLETAFAVRESLRTARFSTDFAYSPDDISACAQAADYAAILVDLDRPDGGGIDMIRRLREQPQFYKTPILVMCASGHWDQRPETNDLNVLECLQKPLNIEQLTQVLARVIVHDARNRPCILHVDDDPDVLVIVAETLATIATVVAVASIDEARCALLENDFDLAILDIRVGAASGLDLLPDLHNSTGNRIPVIIFSGHVGDLHDESRVQANVAKSSSGSLNDLVQAVCDRLRLSSRQTSREVA